MDARELRASNCDDSGGRETTSSTSLDLRFLELGVPVSVSGALGGEN